MTGVPGIEPQTPRSRVQHSTTQPRTRPQNLNQEYRLIYYLLTETAHFKEIVYILLTF